MILLDEIDTGLSGEVAHRMSLIMREMAGRMQVISISHLPQIAAAGNCHFKVYKEDRGETTISGIRKLTPEERVQEIAGMISGQPSAPGMKSEFYATASIKWLIPSRIRSANSS